jgi:hypothetical protein
MIALDIFMAMTVLAVLASAAVVWYAPALAKVEVSEMKNDKFVSWYRAPYQTIEYLADAPDGEGYIYVRNIADAKRFDSEAEARRPTPVYDGSANIDIRSGVYRVRR